MGIPIVGLKIHVYVDVDYFFNQFYVEPKPIDLSRIPTNNSAESRSGWTEIQHMHENVHQISLWCYFGRMQLSAILMR